MSLSRTNQESGLRYLTNRGNLLDALSSGSIRPGIAMQKWYPDLSSNIPELLVLLMQDPSQALTEKASGDQPGQFPVLMDLRNASAHFIVSTANNEPAGNESTVNDAFLASGAIPTGQVARVVFRSSEDLDEFTARQYDNIRANMKNLRFVVDPARFSGSLDGIPESVSNLAPRGIDHSRYGNSARTGSLMVLLGKLVELSGDLDIAFYADVLDRLRKRIAESDRKVLVTSDVLELAQEIVNGYPDHTGQRPLDQDERITLDLVLEVLTRMEPDGFSSRSILESVIEAATTNEVPSANFGRIGDVIDGLADAEETIPLLSQTETSLLTFLRRPEPQRLLTWLDEPEQPDSMTMLIATVFSGLLGRRELLPIEARPANENLERIIDTWMAAWISSSQINLDDIEALKMPIEVQASGSNETLTAGGALILSRPVQVHNEVNVEETTIDPVGAQADPIDELDKDVKPESPNNSGIDPVETLLTSDLTDPDHLKAALVLCEKRPWSDLVQTKISLGGKLFSLDGGRKASELSITIDRFLSATDLEFVIDIPRFRAALEGDRGKITKNMETRMRHLLRGEDMDKPTARKLKAAQRSDCVKPVSKQIDLTD